MKNAWDLDMGTGTGTWMQADWKCEHKNKVKKETTTHQTHCGGRQAGAATTGVVRHGWVQVGRHRAQAGRLSQSGLSGGKRTAGDME